MKLINTLLFLTLFTLSGCSYNQTIGTQRIYEVTTIASEYSEVIQEIPVDAKVDSAYSGTQDTSSEATPDALSTAGKLLVPLL